jgi:hypothetical protein
MSIPPGRQKELVEIHRKYSQFREKTITLLYHAARYHFRRDSLDYVGEEAHHFASNNFAGSLEFLIKKINKTLEVSRNKQRSFDEIVRKTSQIVFDGTRGIYRYAMWNSIYPKQ